MNMQTLRYVETDPERNSWRSSGNTILMSEIDTLQLEMHEYTYRSETILSSVDFH